MRLTLCAVGRLKRGPESDLVDDYLARADAAGRSLGFSAVRLVEVEARGKGAQPDEESRLLLGALPAGALIVLLDEHGEAWPSTMLAEKLGVWRDSGMREAAFLIGGADGHGAPARAAARHVLALGPQTWPHKLARAMMAEQLYRGVSILAGSPYHRGG
jgi:23S rRNA (pseudouridine1915-N3)-methyltransferase